MTHRPPRLALALLATLRSQSLRDSIVGDLCEEFHKHLVPERGVRHARLWFFETDIQCAGHAAQSVRRDTFPAFLTLTQS